MRNFRRLITYSSLFFIPIAMIISILIKLKVSPFGEGSIWYIDLPAQITMFYNHLYEVFRGNSSAIYTWNYGLGTSFWATIWYYLSSPLSILIILLPKSLIPFSILITWLIKIGLSSLTMSFLLKRHFTQNQFVTFIFSLCYALMSFSITYFFLPMWIDAVVLLPIIIAGIHDIIKTDKDYLFLISLTILFFANFYISYMVGIFVFLYFIAECYINDFSKKILIKRSILFFKSVFLACLFTSFVTIPTYLEIRKNNYSSEDVNLLSYLINPIQNPLDLYGYLFNGTTLVQNLSIYAGLGVILLVPLYFFNKSYTVRERISYGLLLAFLLFSMTNRLFNFAWHIFELPNGAFFRYGFIVSFLLIILSVKAMIKVKTSTITQLTGVTVFNILFLSIGNKLLEPEIYTLGLINKNIMMLCAYTILILLLMNNNSQKAIQVIAKVCLCFLIIGDMGLNTKSIFSKYLRDMNITQAFPHDWYNKNNPEFEKAINKLHSIDQSFYRTKVDSSLITSTNDPLRYQYKEMSIYTSTGKSDTNMFLGKLGYLADSRTVSMENGIFLSDVLLGFKYFVTTKELDERIYTKIIEENNIKVYKINLNLPLGYVVNKQFMEVTGQPDIFSVQNSLIQGSESKGQLFYEKLNPIKTGLNSLELKTNDEGTPILQRHPGGSIPALNTTVKISDTRELYIQVDGDKFKYFEEYMEILVNNNPVDPLKINMGPFKLLSLGTYDDQTLSITVRFKNNTQTIQVPDFYTLNYSKLAQEVNRLNSNPLRIIEYTDRKLTGEITIKDDQELLFTSIPYDENWKVSVNGVKTNYQKIGSFIAIEINKGTHKIQLEYAPKTLYISIGVSVISLFGYLIVIFYKARKKMIYRFSTSK